MRIGIIETSHFRRQAKSLLDETSMDALCDYLSTNPESGTLIEGTGGVRKLRWATTGSGKRGGNRIIYFYYDKTIPLFLITAYGKSKKDNLTNGEQAELKKISMSIVRNYKEGVKGRVKIIRRH